MTRPVFAAVAGVLAAAVALGGCDKDEPVPKSSGVQAGQPRIVALSPALGIALRELDLHSSVVGRHGYDSFLPAALPSCGDQDGPDYEHLIAVSPTHVLTQWGSRELPARLVSLASDRHWVLKDFSIVTLNDARDCVSSLDLLLRPADSKTSSPAAARLLAEMDRAWSRRPGIYNGRVILVGSLSPLYVFGPGSCHQEALEAIGGVSAVVSRGAFQRFDFEDVATLKPDAWIILSFDQPSKPGVRALDPAQMATKLPPGMTSLNTCIIEDAECQIQGVSMIRVADELAECLSRFQKQLK
jgi:ABC-type Fe3+-hydroxamate transport system substrate-binding protein